MRLLLDEMYSERVVELLRDRGHPDAEVLARAVEDGRTLVTANASDFLPLLDRLRARPLAPLTGATSC